MLHRAPEVVLTSDPRVGEVPIRDCGEDLVDTHGAIIATVREDGDAYASQAAHGAILDDVWWPLRGSTRCLPIVACWDGSSQ